MASVREVRALLKPLLARNADLALVGRLVVVLPLRTHLRAILIDRTGSADVLNPRWYIHHLCTPKLWCHISWGQELFRRSHGLWRMSNPDTPRVLCEEIEQVALPILRPIETFEDYVEVVSRHERSHLFLDSITKIVIHVALGDLDAARALCTGPIADHPDPSPRDHEVTRRAIEGARRLCGLLGRNDSAGLIRTLHDWEEGTVKEQKLEHLWEWTPLPIELDTTTG
jgi:hypothetical protein